MSSHPSMATGVAQTGSDTTRKAIVQIAQDCVHKVSDKPEDQVGGKRKGWEFLKEILDEALAKPLTWTPGNLAALATPGLWMNVDGNGGTSDSKKAIHWCGIFATYVLRKAGMEVKWHSGVGIKPSDAASTQLRKFLSFVPKPKFDASTLERGDIACIPDANHHFIVIDPNDPFSLKCIAGNGSYQQIEEQKHARNKLNCYYKILK